MVVIAECWNCEQETRIRRDSCKSGEGYCYPCLVQLVQANAGGDNPFKVEDDMATNPQVLKLLDVMTEVGYFIEQGDTATAKIIVDFTLHEHGLTYEPGNDDKDNVTPIR